MTQANMTNPIMQFFKYDHLADAGLQEVSKAVYDLAVIMNKRLPDCAEKTAGLRKLLEAKDCFVRTKLMYE